jgi:hypothetical protein
VATLRETDKIQLCQSREVPSGEIGLACNPATHNNITPPPLESLAISLIRSMAPRFERVGRRPNWSKRSPLPTMSGVSAAWSECSDWWPTVRPDSALVPFGDRGNQSVGEVGEVDGACGGVCCGVQSDHCYGHRRSLCCCGRWVDLAEIGGALQCSVEASAEAGEVARAGGRVALGVDPVEYETAGWHVRSWATSVPRWLTRAWRVARSDPDAIFSEILSGDQMSSRIARSSSVGLAADGDSTSGCGAGSCAGSRHARVAFSEPGSDLGNLGKAQCDRLRIVAS